MVGRTNKLIKTLDTESGKIRKIDSNDIQTSSNLKWKQSSGIQCQHNNPPCRLVTAKQNQNPIMFENRDALFTSNCMKTSWYKMCHYRQSVSFYSFGFKINNVAIKGNQWWNCVGDLSGKNIQVCTY